MRFYLDTEFMEDGTVIIPLSFGLITETGEAFYGVVLDSDRNEANDWVAVNVLPYLDTVPPEVEADVVSLIECHGTKDEVAEGLLNWVNSFGGVPEFWANYGAYDWVLLCQLYGPMIDLPEGWPMFVRDIQQKKTHPKQWLPRPRVAHHCLSDAISVKERWEYLEVLESD